MLISTRMDITDISTTSETLIFIAGKIPQKIHNTKYVGVRRRDLNQLPQHRFPTSLYLRHDYQSGDEKHWRNIKLAWRIFQCGSVIFLCDGWNYRCHIRYWNTMNCINDCVDTFQGNQISTTVPFYLVSNLWLEKFTEIVWNQKVTGAWLGWCHSQVGLGQWTKITICRSMKDRRPR